MELQTLRTDLWTWGGEEREVLKTWTWQKSVWWEHKTLRPRRELFRHQAHKERRECGSFAGELRGEKNGLSPMCVPNTPQIPSEPTPTIEGCGPHFLNRKFRLKWIWLQTWGHTQLSDRPKIQTQAPWLLSPYFPITLMFALLWEERQKWDGAGASVLGPSPPTVSSACLLSVDTFSQRISWIREVRNAKKKGKTVKGDQIIIM